MSFQQSPRRPSGVRYFAPSRAPRPLLLRREAAGEARRCHGDLHLRNIVMIGGDPILFDALEFDERLSTCDILYDFAFLLMDLWTRALFREANALMNHYLSRLEEVEAELEALAALPLFLSLRAAIRAKVTNLEPAKTAETIAAARRLFEAAGAFSAAERPFPRRRWRPFGNREDCARAKDRAQDWTGARRRSFAQRR